MFGRTLLFFLPITFALAATSEECRARGKLYFPKTGKCHNALESPDGCKSKFWWSPRKWIVKQEGNDTGIGICVEKPCSEIDETCKELLRRGPPCSVNQYLRFTNYGYTLCVCKPGYLEPDTGVCHRPYHRGPCKQDEYLIPSTSHELVCLKNVCKAGEVYVDINKLLSNDLPIQRKCVRIDDLKCGHKDYQLTQETFEPYCEPGISEISSRTNMNRTRMEAYISRVKLPGCPRWEYRNNHHKCVCYPGTHRNEDNKCVKIRRP